MTTAYPTALDALANPLAADSQIAVTHSGQHTNINDAMEAVQAYVGVQASVSSSTLTGKVASITGPATAGLVASKIVLPATAVNRGVFAQSTAYALNDYVTSAIDTPANGKIYLCVLAYTSPASGGDPTLNITNWQLQRAVSLLETPAPLSLYGSVNAAVAANPNGQVFAGSGSFTQAGLPTNPRGIDVLGPGKVLVPTTEGSGQSPHQYTFPENDKYQRTFGEEYLFALHTVWQSVGIGKIYLDGDSTISGDYVSGGNLPVQALGLHLLARGVSHTITNRAASGSTIQNFHLSNADIDDANHIVLSFGINNTDGLDAFIASYRSKVALIRARRTYLQCGVTIKTSNAVSDTKHGRDETQAWEQRRALRQLARDFQCHYFDTAGYLADTRNGATGTWNDATNPSTNLTPGWMDDAFRSDPAFRDPTSFGNAIHPVGNLANSWIWGRLADSLLPPGAQTWRTNNFYNLGRQVLLDQALAPSSYPIGIALYRAAGVAGGGNFLADGFLYSIKEPSASAVFQILYSFTDGNSKLLYRNSISGNAWSSWGGATFNYAPVLAGTWVDNAALGGTRIIKNNRAVNFQGGITGGSLTLGTTILSVTDSGGNGFAASSISPTNVDSAFIIPAGTNRDDYAVVRWVRTGTINVNQVMTLTLVRAPATAALYLDGITYFTRDAP